MTTSIVTPAEAGTEIPIELLYRVPYGKVLHGKDCQHLTPSRLATLQPATDLDRQKFKICRSCLIALDGDPGRDDFETFDAALEALHVPQTNRPAMRAIAEGLDTSRIWIPKKGTYVAVSPGTGHEVTAFFSKDAVEVRQEEGGYERLVLSTPTPATPAGRTSAAKAARKTKTAAAQEPEPAPPTCPTCYMQLPGTGICDSCD